MSDADLLFRPVGELAQLVRSGELAARELVDASLDRIDALNPSINAFVDVFHEEARAAADEIGPGDERPFAGVPIAIKNNRPVDGKRLTFGSDFAGEFVVPHDHNVVARLKGAGFIVVGTTTLPEWGIVPTTESRRLGPTRNPWDLERTPGGSSGGSAAAVAAGMVPIAHANDGGGSTRIPAACCGLVGLKPARGRISLAPEIGDAFLVTDGVVTRTVAETAAVLDILEGYVLGDATWAPPPAEPFARVAGRDPGRRRIAVTSLSPVPDAVVRPENAEAARRAAALLAELGHDVVEVDPPWADPELGEIFTASFGPAVCTQMAFMELVNGRAATEEDVEPLSWALWNRCKALDSVTALLAEYRLEGFSRALIAWGAEYDAVLTPSLAEAPVPLGTIDTHNAEDPLAGFTRSGLFTPFTPGANISGQPAISLPLYEDSDGLPLGVQLIGRPADEATVLALSAQIEQAAPWEGRRPPQPAPSTAPIG